MSVNLSPVGGVAAQFLDNMGNVLTGGKLFTYAAGTTVPAAVFTTSLGTTPHPNPIVLDAAGRVPSGGEIWLVDSLIYKFVLQNSAGVVIATYDNITGINSNFVNFTAQQEIQTAAANQTVFNLTTMQYQPGTNSLTVYVDGVNQYGSGAQYAYVETDSDTVTFVSGLPAGSSVKFSTTIQTTTGAVSASTVSYTPPFTGSVSRNVSNKLAESVSVKDFGAVGDGVTDDTAAIQAAVNYVQSFHKPETYTSNSPGPGSAELFFPFGVYKVTSSISISRSISIRGEGHSEYSIGARVIQYTNATDHFTVSPIAQGCSVSWDNLTMTANGGGGTGGSCVSVTKAAGTCNSVRIRGCTFGTPQTLAIKIQASDDVMIHDNLFDVSASSCIALGTSTASDIVSNCAIRGNTFYAISNFGVLTYNVTGLIIAENRIYPSGSKMNTFLDGYNTLPYQVKNVVVQGNTINGVNCLAKVTGVSGFIVNGNNCINVGAGSGAALSCIELTGTCSNINISGNVISGTFDTKNFYNDSGASASYVSINANTFVNTGGTGQAISISPTTVGNVSQNACSGFITPSVGEQIYTSGNAISVGVVSGLGSSTFTKTITGSKQGDKVTLTPASTTWPVPPGIVVTAFVSASNTVSIQYTNVTGSAIGVPAHDFGILVTR